MRVIHIHHGLVLCARIECFALVARGHLAKTLAEELPLPSCDNFLLEQTVLVEFLDVSPRVQLEPAGLRQRHHKAAPEAKAQQHGDYTEV